MRATSEQASKSKSQRWAPWYAGLIATTGLAIGLITIARWQPGSPGLWVLYSLMGALASGMKVRLPGVTGTLSASFLFILLGVADCSLPETLVIAWVATLTQLYWRPSRKPRPIQVAFNLGSTAIASLIAYKVVEPWTHAGAPASPLWLVLAAGLYFLSNTLSVAGIIALTENKSIHAVWKECFFWTLPHYLVGASIAALVSIGNRALGWETSLLVLPVLYLIFRSFGVYVARLEEEKRHAEEIAALHMRTIEALAMAIDAKDSATRDHLQRVQVYAVEIGKELGLSEQELEALRTAALLHDIGKLAVPEYILNKPGRLTPEEFERMKIHPIVGAEILERIQFPYPVAPIVRAHHEKWNGQGYPDGLKGEEIPIGARILAAVDCLDALASDRQYRRALPLEEAVAYVVSEAGKSFDPKVVEVLERRYRELEAKVRSASALVADGPQPSRVATNVQPAAGFESSALPALAESTPSQQDPVAVMARAHAELQQFCELSQEPGVDLDDLLAVLGVRLRKVLPCEAAAIYVLEGGVLVPRYVCGQDAALLAQLRIPVGEGLAGWVAETRRPIVNGNPAVEPAGQLAQGFATTLGAALAVPLECAGRLMGVLALYRLCPDSFTRADLEVLLSVSPKIAFAINRVLRSQQARPQAGPESQARLLDTREFFVRLDSEIARAREIGGSIVVAVWELDGLGLVRDVYGRVEADRLVRAAGERFRHCCRREDAVARLGQGHFGAILSDADRTTGLALAERLTKALEALATERCGFGVTISFGLAVFPEDGGAPAELLAAAERSLYHARLARTEREDAPAGDEELASSRTGGSVQP